MNKRLLYFISSILLCAALCVGAFAADLGDVDGNGRINSADARIALRAAARLETLDYDSAVRADVDCNGRLNSSDARIILRVAAKLQEAPATEPEVTLPPKPTEAPTTEAPTTEVPTTEVPTTEAPTTEAPTTAAPTTEAPTTAAPTTEVPTTEAPTTEAPTTEAPTTEAPTTEAPTEPKPVQPAEPGALTPKQIYNVAKDFTVEISVEGHNEEYGDFTGTGSGFYISKDGRLITNYHVIDGAKKITVKHYDGSEYEVKVIEAYDKNIDLAILRVESVAVDKPAAISAEAVETGDVIYTLGSSLGLTGTFTQGIVSNAARVDKSFNAAMTYIQFDAAITNGNSGGPLINEKGEVVGVIDWGYNEGQNLNFAIPVSYIDKLYVNPVAVEDFAGGSEMNASSAPDAPRYTGIAMTDGTRANVKPHTPASVIFTICSTLDGNAIGELELNISGAPENVTVKNSGWLYTYDGAGNVQPFVVIAMWAEEPVAETRITISVEGAPNFTADFLLTVSESGSGNYFGFGTAPDFGAAAGVSPDDFTMTDTIRILWQEISGTVPPTFIYENVKAETANGYLKTLEDAGYTLNTTQSAGIGSTQYVYDAPGGVYQLGVTLTRKALRGYTVEIQLTDFVNPENPVLMNA